MKPIRLSKFAVEQSAKSHSLTRGKFPGEDSLQALTRALEFTSRVLPDEAERAGGDLQWLGERENLVFANTFMSRGLERNLENCITGLTDAVGVLENGASRRVARPLAERLRALIASGGHTADPRRIVAGRVVSGLRARCIRSCRPF